MAGNMLFIRTFSLELSLHAYSFLLSLNRAERSKHNKAIKVTYLMTFFLANANFAFHIPTTTLQESDVNDPTASHVPQAASRVTFQTLLPKSKIRDCRV